MNNKLDVLAFGAHPDDVELGCGGSLLKLVSQGKTTGIIDLTRGELGTRGTPETRLKEAENAATILKVSARENLGLPDGFVKNTKENQMKLIEVIRKYKPSVVLAPALEDRHIDHGNAAKLVADSCFLAGLKAIKTEYEAHRPSHVFHYIQWKSLTPDFIMDISGFLEDKIDSCLAYKSQFYDPDSKEPETAISSKNFKDSIEHRAKEYGRIVWKDAGEGFQVQTMLGVDSVMDFI